MASIFDISGVGGVLAVSMVLMLALCYGLTVRWIANGSEDDGHGERKSSNS